MRTSPLIGVLPFVLICILCGAVIGEERYDGLLGLAGVLREQGDEADSIAAADSCCEPCCGLSHGCCGPTWTFKAGTLIIERSTPDGVILARDNAALPLLNANQFDLDYRAGFELSAVRHNVCCTCWDLEARYFRVDGWQATREPLVSAGAWVQYATPLGNGLATEISGSYESHLDGFELNLRRALGAGWLTVLGGFRYVELDEQGLNIIQDIGPGLNTAVHEIGAVNDLYGFQLGADGRLWECGRLSADAFVRAGVYANRAVNRTVVTQTVAPGFACRGTSDHTSFLGELGVTGTCRMTDSLAVTAGYQMMWLEGVAVASDQVAVSDPAAGSATVDTSGSPFYHGAIISLECRR